jgi:glycosyltransferase involved in cell wall biosynthesis
VRTGASKLSIVIVTYAWPRALDVIFAALSEQSDGGFEVVVADDGSGPETAAVIERWREAGSFPIEHVWQPNQGWRKSRVLNLGALAARGDYLLFLDGDSIPRRHFVAAFRRCMLPGWFLASKRIHLSRQLSQRVVEQDLPVWRWSVARWLLRTPREFFTTHREAGSLGLLVPIRDRRRPWRARQPEFSPPWEAYGFCFGVHRTDFERVNGFDLRFENWGGEDEDIAARLRRAGVRCGWPGPAATMLHLWHPVKRGTMASNKHLVRESLASSHVRAEDGLQELAAELAQASANRVGASSASSEPEKR